MNFYKHHLGDYAQATGHLSFVEDAAYSRLIRKYYAEERPIPCDLKSAQRLVGARTKDEREAVNTVLEEFFTLSEDGWHNKRCDGELASANAQAETNRRITDEREAKRRARKADESLDESSNESSTNRTDGDSTKRDTNRETNRQPSQTPDSRLQTPDIPDTKRARPISAGEATKAMREAGLADANPSHPKLIALLQAGITVDELRSAAKAAAEGGKGFAYALGKAEGRRRDAVVTPLPGARTGPAPHAAEPEWRREQRERMEQAAPYAVSRPTAARTTPETFTDDEATDVLPLARPSA